MSPRLNLSLRRIWVLLVLLSVVTPLTITTIWYGYHHYNSELKYALLAEREANERLRYQIEAEVQRLVTVLKDMGYSIAPLMDNTGNSTNNLKKIDQLLATFKGREGTINALMLLSKEGSPLVSIGPDGDSTATAPLSAKETKTIKKHWRLEGNIKSPEFIIAMAGRTYIDEPPSHGTPLSINIAVPVASPPHGVLISQILISKLWDISSSARREESTKMTRNYILNSRGTLLNSIEGSDYKRGDLMTHFPIVRTALINGQWPSTNPYIGVINKSVFGTLTHIPLLNWTLVSEVITAPVIRGIWSSLRIIIYFNILIIIISLWIAFLLIKNTSTPIRKACVAINRVASGDYSYSLKHSGIRELDAMATDFNKMTYARQNAEHEIKRSLKEKEVLLAEIHHRVKNNLQVISGLLMIQHRAFNQGSALSIDELFEESRNRIKSMAVIHDLLYRSGDISGIELQESATQVASDLIKTFAMEDRVNLSVTGSAIRLGIDQAIPCSLIINEMMMNCLKHAFPNERRGNININLSKQGANGVVLKLSDDGVGLPKGLDWKNNDSVGLDLINGLSRQINAKIELDTNNGTSFTIKFQAK